MTWNERRVMVAWSLSVVSRAEVLDKDVQYFKKKYKVPFPLFPDEDKSIYTALGKPRAPYFIGVKIGKDGNSQVFYSKLGAFGKPDTFLALMFTLSGLE